MSNGRKAKSIQQARRAETKKDSKSNTDAGVKRGGWGYFQGAPLELLEKHFPRYRQTVGTNREYFWSTLQAEWTTAYPNDLTPEQNKQVTNIKKRLRLDGLKHDNEEDGEDSSKSSDEEPLATSLNNPEEKKKGSTDKQTRSKRQIRALRSLQAKRTEEENVLLAKAADFDARIKSWFVNRLSKENSSNKGREVWKGFERTLDKKVLGSKPCPLRPEQIYLGLPPYKAKVDAEFQRLHGKAGGKDYLKNITAVAKTLYDQESEEVKEDVRKAVEARRADELRQFEELKQADWHDTDDPEVINARRQQLPAIIKHFIELACKFSHTSFSGVLMGENTDPNGDENSIFSASVMVGETPGPDPMTFDQWDPLGYRYHHVKSYAQFFVACSRLRKG
ncbi:hypothetical protein K435DRAFT_809151 [Dendrothele bispora CBS 962.96]|uniref:Uncharacterized protein n=1 Tax=Dendrothele bispora (strain CBS 962.96) TaxID=1314807 RepID=A0A4S8KZ62_DENBC|nr:hypothetical protein K435DRAFT_809151 [Dendrothele bispora CBS 962.96]